MITIQIEDFNLKDILTCGQCFRWQVVGELDWLGVAGGKVLRVVQNGSSVTFHCRESEFEQFWRYYFDIDRDYKAIKNEIITKMPDMAEAIAFGSGIRMLNQEPFEMLITYILSANNNIPRITELVRKISEAFGERIEHPWEDLVGPLYAFPRPEVLAAVPIENFRSMGAGYRDKYLHESALKVAEDPEAFLQIGALPYKDAKAALLAFAGVGPKVADCILLFSSGKHEAFPIDTWIKKTVARRYGLPENKQKVIEAYIEEKFGPLKGFANQYLFYYERSL